MKTIKCTCGETINLKYSEANRITTILSAFYEWACHKCGQIYREEVKNPIYL